MKTREGGTRIWRRSVTVFGFKFGIEHSIIYSRNRPYLERWIVLCGGSIRLHKFYNGDEEVPHDHPWWFVTFPLRTYTETTQVWNDLHDKYENYIRKVKGWRFHFRPASHRHYIRDVGVFPFYTLVITGQPRRDADGVVSWGFYTKDDVYVRWDKWTENTYI